MRRSSVATHSGVVRRAGDVKVFADYAEVPYGRIDEVLDQVDLLNRVGDRSGARASSGCDWPRLVLR